MSSPLAPPAPRPSARPGVWVAGGVLAYVAFGAALALNAPLDWDEAHFYLPAIKTIAKVLPQVSLDYPLPMPPLGVYLHAVVYRLSGGSVVAVRCVELLATALLLWVVVRHLKRRDPAGRWGPVVLAVFSYPFLVNGAFLMKVNGLAALLCVVALTEHLRAEATGSWRARIVSTACMSCAVLTHQMAMALALFLFLDALRRRGEETVLDSAPGARRAPLPGTVWGAVAPVPTRFIRAAVAAAPGVVMLALVIAWGGIQPPSFRSTLIQSEVSHVTLRPGQPLVALASIGLWLLIVEGLPRARWLLATLAAGAASAAVHLTQIIASSSYDGPYLRGPIQRVADRLSAGFHFNLTADDPALVGWYPVKVAIVGALAGLGFAFMIHAFHAGGLARRWTLFALCYAGMMNFVPYHYEQYYLLLIVPSYLFLADAFVAAPRTLVLTAMRAAVAVLGFALAVRSLP